MPEQILVLRPGAIGDTLVTLPALLALRRRFPNASIQLAGNSAVLPLLQTSGIIDTWLSFDSPQITRLFVSGEPTATDSLMGKQVAVAWCGDPERVLRQALEMRGAQRPVIASSRPVAGRTVHVARYLLETLAPLGIMAGETLDMPTITPPAEAVVHAHADLTALGLAGRPFVAVHPGSGSRAKNWPAERFAAVINTLSEQYQLPCLILVGPADDDVLGRLAEHVRMPLAVLAERPLTVVAALLQQARAFLGNDSGLAHLAGQLGVPTLALFGPMDPAVWSPLGPRVRTLRADPLTDLPSETVLSTLRSLSASEREPEG